MEEKISKSIITSFFRKLEDSLSVDVAIVGAGPSGLIAAKELAEAGRKVAVFESKLAPGGGIWGGGMLFNEIVLQEHIIPILDEYAINYLPAGDGYVTADAVEVASSLIYGAVHAGVRIFNTVRVEDLMMRDGHVCGVVINWNPVARLEMHVDPLVITAKAVLDGTGHPSELISLASNKAGISLDTPTGKVMGEKPMWMENGETSTVINTKRLYPGLYASGMAANNVMGGFRMGPIFGGMFLSGKKAAGLILEDLDKS
ncbi:sulfide-dependent adenosine diphosphate thiazole synthase [Prosthecochloris sp. HL-130-GSB]|jgi:sulfide-dependent adenosine diphosphate thiazole synthase|uniref:sulfide-dependent adenosine diphosphate thiazole synthase n=1 Tax=Prosthecochloris sp. HL-130-GSB TaxID=1974213 RepID=UPI000A1C015C|nr:sulfide-dependent adenosine diphosphate thiazole synthase [Prosthecochloris sp. HL-130-GSB]ARM30991.1 ribose 1,5-bisphosphate isomerase [Prosthecochloris sp. HL-130-GSB]MBO8092214.1 thiazole biosynthesis protein [Prosthecochloris sp.]